MQNFTSTGRINKNNLEVKFYKRTSYNYGGNVPEYVTNLQEKSGYASAQKMWSVNLELLPGFEPEKT